MMSSKELRSTARAALKDRYWDAFGACVIFCLITGLVSAVTQIQTKGRSFIVFFILFVISFCGSVFRAVLNIGISKYFLRFMNNDNPEMSVIFSYKERMWKCFGLELLIFIKVLVWSLLFIVPGIIASINYSQASFIFAENPDLSPLEAIELSKKMMKQRKWDYFYLVLSFIGWFVLCIITCGIGFLFLSPYFRSAITAFYNDNNAEIEKYLNYEVKANSESGANADSATGANSDK